MNIFPEEQELHRLEDEQYRLEEQVTQAELTLETEKAEAERFRHRYYQAVGHLFAEVDDLDAQLAYADMLRSPGNPAAQMQAQKAQTRAENSAEEAGLVNARPEPPPDITAELKQAYRKATRLIHPDRATSEAERLRRTHLMAQVNKAYERGDLRAIEKLMTEFGQDPESIAGEDTASRIVKTIRRIAQLRRRLVEAKQELQLHRKSSISQLKKTIETAEAMGGNPLGDLVKQLTQSITERKIRLEIARRRSGSIPI
jgi:small-conductance mechanosensitive channel